jgi:5-methylcytosine-specific restriction enzyme A
MPTAAPRPCSHAGCNVLVRDGSGRCEKHPRVDWRKKPDAPKRITGRRLQAMRARLFRRQPLCELCEARGVVRAATERDHKVPLAEGGTDDEDNDQALCHDCHEAKSLQERLRAQGRARA